jgi:hypothetical protein
MKTHMAELVNAINGGFNSASLPNNKNLPDRSTKAPIQAGVSVLGLSLAVKECVGDGAFALKGMSGVVPHFQFK